MLWAILVSVSEQKNSPEVNDVPEQLRIRREKRERLLDSGVEAYPVTVDRTISMRDLRHEFQVVAEGEEPGTEEGVTYLTAGEETDTEHAIAGRLIFMRNTGKLCFATLQDGDGTQVQAMLSLAEIGEEQLAAWKSDVDLGDFISVRGRVIASRRGELSIMATKWTMAAKSLRPLPVAFADMNEETRVRQRYNDLIVREEARKNAMTRVKVMRALRNYLEDQGFVEIETPMLLTLHGGAAARPFVTHSNALDIDLYLRIAPELYLKRAVVGGIVLLGRVVRVVVREHHWLGGVLVGAHVDHAGVVGRVLDEAREVVVEAELLLGIGCGLLVDVELWSTLDDWVAPRDEHGLLVAGRDDDLVLGVGLDGVEKHALCGGQLNLGVGSLAAARSGGGASSRIGGGRRARCKRRGAADGDHGQAAGAQGGAAGDLVTEVFVIRGVFAFTQAGVAALIGAGKA